VSLAVIGFLGLNQKTELKTETEIVGFCFSSQPIGSHLLKTEVLNNRKNRTEPSVKTERPG
jgi:hypothetical protein